MNIPDRSDGAVLVLWVGPDPKLGHEVGEMLGTFEPEHFVVECVDRLGVAMDRLGDHAFEAVLFDASDGDLSKVNQLVQSFPALAVIVFVQPEKQDLAVKALRSGAQDCLIHGEWDLTSLARSVRFAIERRRVRPLDLGSSGESKRLRLLEAAAEQASDAILICTAQAHDPASHEVVYVNPAFTRMTGYEPGEILAQSPFLLGGPETDRDRAEQLFNELTAGRTLSGEMVAYDKDRSEFIMQWQVVPLRGGADGEVTHLVAIQRDVTEQRRMENQLRQSQKMEAVGRLAGGVSHDFNNLLTAIIGYNQLLLNAIGPEHPQRDAVEQIGKAAKRAANLTGQLLAFSRRQVLQLKVIDFNEVLNGIEPILRRLIGEDIDLEIRSTSKPAKVKSDPGQLEQVILNLAINARDAMPHGGQLMIEIGEVELGAEAAREIDGEPGAYIRVQVRDSGLGMDAETQAKIFEPFFTTKGKEKGTGLGLATVYGIVKQSGGFLSVESEFEQGTMFTVFLPRSSDIPVQPLSKSPAGKVEKGDESVLLAEDDESVRHLVSTVLLKHGYRVLEAADGGEALSLAAAMSDPIDLLISDVVMPDMRGPELVERILASRPGLRTLYISGYADGSSPPWGEFGSDVPFLQKPFSPDKLMRKVREVLDQPPAQAAGSSRDEDVGRDQVAPEE